MSPAGNGGEDGVGGFGPDKWLGLAVGFGDEAVDGGLEVDDRGEDPRLRRCRVSLANQPSTALAQEQEVGVKWKVKRRCRWSQAVTLGCL